MIKCERCKEIEELATRILAVRHPEGDFYPVYLCRKCVELRRIEREKEDG